MLEKHCIGLLSSQCCLNTSKTTLHKKDTYTKKILVQCWSSALPDPTLHKKITFAMLTYCPQTTLHRKKIYNFVWIYLGQHCIKKLLAQCWPREHRYTFAGKPAFPNMSGGLFFNHVHYHRTILALFDKCWLRSSFTACGTTITRDRHWLKQ